MAVTLARQEPPCPHAAVSRLYYALFQAVCRVLVLRDGTRPSAKHRELWLAANTIRDDLYRHLQDLYAWRRKADYASGEVPATKATQLVADYYKLTNDLCNH